MEQKDMQLYIDKLKESIQLNQALLTVESETHKELNDFNLRFQEILQQVFERSQTTLPFLESLTAKLTESENQALILFATQTTSSHQQFFEVWKEYKDLEARSASNLASSVEKIRSFTIE